MGKKGHPAAGRDVQVPVVMWEVPHSPPPPPPPPPLPQLWTPWLIPLFALANTAAFVYSLYINDCPSSTSHPPSDCLFPTLRRFSFEPLYVNFLLGPSPFTLDKLGALDYYKVVVNKEKWRFMACIWLHAGLIHLFANMLSLLFIGIRLEQEFGFVKIGILYIISGLGGSLMSCLSRRENSVGASGALFGLLGAMLSELITNWTIYDHKCAALSSLIFIIAINLAVGLLPHVDSSAHFGGFISGFLLGFVLLMRPQFGWISRKHIPPGYDIKLVKPKYKFYQYFLWFVSFILLVYGFMNAYTELFPPNKKL
ncbi:putative peptidase S54, rhomboid, Rhomboid-like superfamily [Dioscorea sansibarensis]